ncbi:MAG: PfkB family carbohydrate kinase [Candidatus Gorgyraea atricola]|nr:PfkB family carbohydrate kinase [Candidatus Gorgyraea atricola]
MPIDILFLGGTSIDLIQKSRGPASAFFTASVGGGITNSSIIAAKLGLKVAMLSRIGKDPLGDWAIKELGRFGVNTKGVIQDSNIKTPLAVANIDRHGNSKYTFYKNSPKDSIVPLISVPKSLLNSCKAFHFGSSFSYQKESSEEALKYVKYLKKRGIFISFDPNIRPYAIKDKKAAKNRVLRLLEWVDLARFSEIDLEFLGLKKRLKCKVILTLGAKGSEYLDCKGKLIKVPAKKVKVVDTIGAGDAFNAALLYRIIKIGGRQVFFNIKPHLTFASKIASQICAKSGSH